METAEDIYYGVPREKLDSPITDLHIADLAFMLTTWEELAPYLGLTPGEEEAIQVDYQGRYGLQKRQALRKWKSKVGRGPKGATYRQLIIVLCRARDKEMADKVREILMATSDTLDTFHKYLVDCYTITQHPSHTQWPFSRLSSYIDLTLVQAPDTQMPQSGQGESWVNSQPLREVQLGELFHVGSQRKVVLVEGPAGCGKTTLSWHVCREWAAGRLFQQSFLLIHISLEDQNVLRAERLADIIPHESSEMREAVAEAISEQDGKDVCFLFDAWDEAPRALQGRSSFLFKFISGTSTRKIPQCSIMVTSRPVAACLLYPHLTAHINIKGFGEKKLKQFIDASLKDHDSRHKLLQALREKPQVNDLCNLPINAAIVVHLFRSHLFLPFHFTLPSTRTGIFRALVCNLLLRHMQLRTSHELQQIKEFERLPGEVLQEYQSICGLAFHGVMKETKAFLMDSLEELGLTYPSNTLGLLQVQQQLTGFGPHHSYNFLHYAVQEFLAAYHISKLSEEKQTKTVGKILHSTPLSTVLPFYAGLTGLSNEGACGMLLEVTKQPLDNHAVAVALKHTLHESSDRRRMLLALLNCIYEAQKPSICALVNPPLHPTYIGMLQENRADPDIYEQDRYFSFDYLGLDAVDCLSIGYFIHKMCLVSKNLKDIFVHLGYCYIGSTEIEILLKHIRQVPLGGPTVSLNLQHNTMSHGVIKSISDTLIRTSVLAGLYFNGCFHPAVTDIQSALKYLIEGVSGNSSLIVLSLVNCSLGPKHAYYLALLAAVCNTVQLYLALNNISSAIPFIAEAIKHNRAINLLHLDGCCICDRALLILGEALQQNDTITELNIGFNPFSSNALTLFLKGFIGTNSSLHTVVVYHSLSDEQRRTVRIINNLRFYLSAPPLQVTDMAFTGLASAETVQSLHSVPPDILTRSTFRDSNTNSTILSHNLFINKVARYLFNHYVHKSINPS